MLFFRTTVAVFATLAVANPQPAGDDEICASLNCAEDTSCTVVSGTGYCVPLNTVCGPSGAKKCPEGTACCNHTCGFCAPLGETCDTKPCNWEHKDLFPPADGNWGGETFWEACQKGRCPF